MTKRQPYLDGARSVAIIAVVACHASGFSGAAGFAWWGKIGYQLKDGVAIFFVLSGYLLYRPFLTARLEGRSLSAGSYAWRRALRIVPAYWLALTVLAIWPGLPGVFSSRWWVYYGFGQVYSTHTAASGLAVAWSLGAEIGFYILLPAYAWLLSRVTPQRVGRRWVATELTAVLLVSIAAVVTRGLAGIGDLPGWLLFTVAGSAAWFALGILLAVARVTVDRDPGSFRRLRWLAARPSLCWGGAAVVLVVNAFANSSQSNPGFWHRPLQSGSEFLLSGLFGWLVLLPAVFPARRRTVVLRFLSWPPVVGLGVISYGVFLWHYPLDAKLVALLLPRQLPWFVQTAALFALDLAAATAIALVSWRLLERPMLSLKNKHLRRVQVAESAA